MKQTRVPAQITTVEDKIAGNLSFTQILLLIAALFCATAIYLLAPKPLKFTAYKLPLIVFSSMFFLLLAIRIRGKVILTWFFLITTYSFRPKYYVFNKNDMTGREIIHDEVSKKVKEHATKKEKVKKYSERPSFSDVAAFERVVLNPNRNVRFAFRKGGIRGIVSEGK